VAVAQFRVHHAGVAGLGQSLKTEPMWLGFRCTSGNRQWGQWRGWDVVVVGLSIARRGGRFGSKPKNQANETWLQVHRLEQTVRKLEGVGGVWEMR
jgi:hypothetical protein